MNICVLICDTGQVLDLSIRDLLSAHGDIEAIHCPSSDESGMIQAIASCQPDVVIITLCGEFTNQSFLDRLLMMHPNLCIITVNIANNWVQVFTKRNLLISRAEELVDLIRGYRVAGEAAH